MDKLSRQKVKYDIVNLSMGIFYEILIYKHVQNIQFMGLIETLTPDGRFFNMLLVRLLFKEQK
jgi:hypothetical protein